MKVYGYTPTKVQINKVIRFMQTSDSFKTTQVEELLIEEGVPKYKDYNYIAMRVADRLLIQQLRKNKQIQLIHRYRWSWVK